MVSNNKDNLEKKIEIDKSRINKDNNNNNLLNLDNIALTTLGYGFAGAVTPNPDFFIPFAAIVGCVVSFYNEVKKKNLDLRSPVIAGLVGGFIGSYGNNLSLNEIVPNLTIYSGALVGTGLGIYNSMINRNKN